MANMVIPNDGKARLLNWLFPDDGSGGVNIIIRLYSNDFTPINGTTTADFVEATFPGYAEITYTRADMSAAAIVANVAECTFTPSPTWTCSGGGGELIYGWFAVTDDDDTTLMAQRFATPRDMTTGATELLDPFKVKLKTFT